ncbi:MAG: hypothetical protein IPK20_13360 [Betaproteobacteria bacterium]|nr:hypothetical protein [Betaproteobacteria bacterium]
MPASPRQMDVTNGRLIVSRMSAKIAAASPVAFASSSAVTGSYEKSAGMRAPEGG